MKIGILTQRLRVNYGGLLQNFALQQVLISLGYDVETININILIKKKPFPINILIYIKRFIKNIYSGISKLLFSTKEFIIQQSH